MTDHRQGFDIAAIRQLLRAAFDAKELRRFCYDRPKFRPVVDRFGPGHGLDDMVDELIAYCETRLLFPELLSEVQEEHSRQYNRFAPYYQFAPSDPRTWPRWLGVLGPLLLVMVLAMGAWWLRTLLRDTSVKPTQTSVAAVTATPAPTDTPMPSPRPTDTPTSTPSETPTPTMTATSLPTPTFTPTPTPSTRITQLEGVTGETPRDTKVEWDPSHQPMVVQFYRGGALIKEYQDANSGEVDLEWAPPGEMEIKLWMRGELTPSASVTITVALPSRCEQAKFVNPNGIRDVDPDPDKLLRVPKDTTIMWEPQDCRMDVEFNQYGTVIEKLFDVGSGEADFTWMEGNGQTEIKIWVPGPPEPSDAMQISIE